MVIEFELDVVKTPVGSALPLMNVKVDKEGVTTANWSQLCILGTISTFEGESVAITYSI